MEAANQMNEEDEMVVDEETCYNNDADETEMLEENCLGRVLDQYESQTFNDGPTPQAIQQREELRAPVLIHAEPVQSQRLLANSGPNQNV